MENERVNENLKRLEELLNEDEKFRLDIGAKKCEQYLKLLTVLDEIKKDLKSNGEYSGSEDYDNCKDLVTPDLMTVNRIDFIHYIISNNQAHTLKEAITICKTYGVD